MKKAKTISKEGKVYLIDDADVRPFHELYSIGEPLIMKTGKKIFEFEFTSNSDHTDALREHISLHTVKKPSAEEEPYRMKGILEAIRNSSVDENEIIDIDYEEVTPKQLEDGREKL